MWGINLFYNKKFQTDRKCNPKPHISLTVITHGVDRIFLGIQLPFSPKFVPLLSTCPNDIFPGLQNFTLISLTHSKVLLKLKIEKEELSLW